MLDLVLQLELLPQARHFRVDAGVFKPSQYLVNSVCPRVVSCELMNLHVSEWDGELGRIWGVDIDRSAVWGRTLLYAAYDFLAVISVVDIRCKHPLVGLFVVGDIEGIEAEGGWVIREVWKSRVVVVFNLRRTVVVDRFLDFFNACGCPCETFEHVDKTRVGGFSDHVGRWDKYGRGCSDVYWG